MSSVIRFKQENTIEVPDHLQVIEERFSEPFLEHFYDTYTLKGDVILDPFMGLGTSALIAERMGRNFVGFEPRKERYDFAKSSLHSPAYLFNASSRDVEDYTFPEIDFVVSSPPYTHREHNHNPLRTEQSDTPDRYKEFLSDTKDIYSALSKVLKPNKYCLVEVSNIIDEHKQFSPLAWDLANEIQKVMSLEKELIIEWDKLQYDLNHTYCFIFRNFI